MCVCVPKYIFQFIIHQKPKGHTDASKCNPILDVFILDFPPSMFESLFPEGKKPGTQKRLCKLSKIIQRVGQDSPLTGQSTP